ncbi:hypothetical protein EON80_10550, partial [bacterium]
MTHPKTILSRSLFAATTALTLGQLPSPVRAQTPSPDKLAQGFASPPSTMRPRCYWYWMDGCVTKDGITKDLENMKRVGIGEAYIGIIGGQAGNPGNGVKILSEEWWGLVEHAIRAGGRLGVDIGFFNSPGWSQSGGPWVKPGQAMRHVVSSEIRLHGPQHFEGVLPTPTGSVNEIATIAFPSPLNDTDDISKYNPKISGDTRNARLFDGNPATTAPAGAMTLELAEPFTARSLVITPARLMQLSGELQVSDDGQKFRPVRGFSIDRHNDILNVGPVPLAPVAITFPAATGKFFRFSFSGGDELAEIDLSSA